MQSDIAIDAFDALAARYHFRDDRNCQWRIARAPVGNVRPDDFRWAETDIPEPEDGEVLLKTLYLGLAPVMRMYMQGTGAAGERVLSPGDVIHGRGVAQIVRSRHSDWQEGEIVQGQIGWQGYKVSAMTAQEKMFRCHGLDLDYALNCGVLAMTGLSAHAGFFRCGDPKPTDTIVVSGAAGGVGSMVIQMAKHVVGAKRVIGIAGGPEKCTTIKALGCDDAIDYKAGPIAPALQAICPEGIDLYFDNVGGETLATVLENLAFGARIVLCGSISEYARSEPFGLTNYARLRRVEGRMTGFFVYNHLDQFESTMSEMADWIRSGRLTPVQDIIEGFEAMPRALANLYFGKNVGVQCCRVRPDPEKDVLQ